MRAGLGLRSETLGTCAVHRPVGVWLKDKKGLGRGKRDRNGSVPGGREGQGLPGRVDLVRPSGCPWNGCQCKGEEADSELVSEEWVEQETWSRETE